MKAAAVSSADRIDLSGRRGVQEMVISVKFLDRVIETYSKIAGWELIHRGDASQALPTHWQLPPNVRVEEALMGAPGADKCFARFIKFHGVDQVQIRSGARPFDTGGIFNISMLVRDIDLLFEEMRDHGFVAFSDPNHYKFRGNDWAGAMLVGHDGIIVNLVQRGEGDYACVPAYTKMSLIPNATQIVADYDESLHFFCHILDWHKNWEAQAEWPEDGSNNMCLPDDMVRKGLIEEKAVGFVADQHSDVLKHEDGGGRMEILHFDGVTGKDFSSRAHAPNLGIMSYRVHCPDVQIYIQGVEDRGGRIIHPLRRYSIAPYGSVNSATIRAPNGSWIECFEQD